MKYSSLFYYRYIYQSCFTLNAGENIKNWNDLRDSDRELTIIQTRKRGVMAYSNNKEIVALSDLFLVHETHGAYLIETVESQQHWIAKSLVEDIDFGEEIREVDRKYTEIISLEIPEWLAEQKGLI